MTLNSFIISAVKGGKISTKLRIGIQVTQKWIRNYHCTAFDHKNWYLRILTALLNAHAKKCAPSERNANVEKMEILSMS